MKKIIKKSYLSGKEVISTMKIIGCGACVGNIDLMNKGLRLSRDKLADMLIEIGNIDLMNKGLRRTSKQTK